MVLPHPILLASKASWNPRGGAMNLGRSAIGILTLALAVSAVQATAWASNGYDASLLDNHEESLPIAQEVQMWECWEDRPGSSPRLLQKVGKRWVTLDTATVYRDSKTCGKKTPIRADYTFTLENSFRWNKKKKSYEAVVRTVCSTCVTYNWTILVDK